MPVAARGAILVRPAYLPAPYPPLVRTQQGRAVAGLGLRVDSVEGGYLHGAVPGRAAQDDLAERDVVAGRGLVQHFFRVRGDLDVIGAVRRVRDVERLASLGLEVGVTPAERQFLGHPQRRRRPALSP